jgi:hypothetical protein
MAGIPEQYYQEPWSIEAVEGHIHSMTVLVEGAWEPLLAARAVLPAAAAKVLDQTVVDAARGRAYHALARYFLDHPAYRDGDLLSWHLVPLPDTGPSPPGRIATVVLGALAPDAFLQALDVVVTQARADASPYPAGARTVFPCRDPLCLLPASGKLARGVSARALDRARREPARYALVTVLLREDELPDDEDEDVLDDQLMVVLRAVLAHVAPETPLPLTAFFRLLQLGEDDLGAVEAVYMAIEDLDQEPGYIWDQEEDSITILSGEQAAINGALRFGAKPGENVTLDIGRRVDQTLTEVMREAQESGDFDTALALVPHLRWRAEQAVSQATPTTLELLRALALPLAGEDPWTLIRLLEQFYATLDNAAVLQDATEGLNYVLAFVMLAELLGQVATGNDDPHTEPDARAALLDVARSSLRRAGEVLDRQAEGDLQEVMFLRAHVLQILGSMPDLSPSDRLELLRSAERILTSQPAGTEGGISQSAWIIARFDIQLKIAAVLAARGDTAALEAYDQVVAGLAGEPAEWTGLRWQALHERGLLRLKLGDGGGIADLQAALAGLETYPDIAQQGGEARVPAPLRFAMARVARDLGRALLDRQEPGDAAEAARVLRKARQRAQALPGLISMLDEVAGLEQLARAATRPAQQRRRPRGSH